MARHEGVTLVDIPEVSGGAAGWDGHVDTCFLEQDFVKFAKPSAVLLIELKV